MRFIKFTGWGENYFTIAMDFIGNIEPDGPHTLVELQSGKRFHLEIDYEDFIGKIFSDRHNEKEYELIEIEHTFREPPQPADINRLEI